MTVLQGLRILILSGIGPSRYAGMLLADLGAQVVIVERPGQGPRRGDTVVTRGQQVVVLDLKDLADRDRFLGLVAHADVVVDPYRPGVVEKLGIGPAECQARNLRLIYARMTGWGQTGPWAKVAGHDINYIAITGVLDAIGRADGPPQLPLNLVGDFAGGSLFLVTGILAAAYERSMTGRGRVVDAAIVDGTVSLAGFIYGLRADGQWDDERGTNILDTGAPYYDVYRTADGRWMSVGAIEPQFFALLVQLLELSDVPDQNDRQQWPRLRAMVAERFAQQTLAHWADVFDGTDACVAPVLNWTEAANHRHLKARGSLSTEGPLQPAPAPRFGDNALPTPPAPASAIEYEALLQSWV